MEQNKKPMTEKVEVKKYQKPVAVKLGSVLLIKGNNHFKSDMASGKVVGLL